MLDRKLRLFTIFSCFFLLQFAIGNAETPDFFNKANCKAVTWAHAVNSRNRLEIALKDATIDMLEADVLMGKLNMTEEFPILARPPSFFSDISFKEFLDKVISDGKRKKGIKFVFRDIRAVEPSLKILNETGDKIKFPIWLHADVLPGPIKSTNSGLNPQEFILRVLELYPKGVLSLGWTTHQKKGNNLTSEGYTEIHINSMLNILGQFPQLDQVDEITFSMRATFVLNSDSVSNLVGGRGRSLTLWSYPEDKLNKKTMDNLNIALGEERIYLDLNHDSTIIKSHHENADQTTNQDGTNHVGPIHTSSFMLLNFLVLCYLVFITKFFI